MNLTTFVTKPSSSSPYFIKLWNPNPRSIRVRYFREKEMSLFLKSTKCDSSSLFPLKSDTQNPRSSVSCSIVSKTPLENSDVAIYKLQLLVSEFQSLSEPIDRVKRLLHYASLLPLLDESDRIPLNRVTGCSVEVWLVSRLDELGRMRFSADSDSEITKGFCSCLIWILDGAYPDEVVKVKTEDLVALNVGLHGRAHSRVNTWHNVLISMQKRTKILVSEREEKPLVDPFSPLVLSTDELQVTRFKHMGSLIPARVDLADLLAWEMKRMLKHIQNMIGTP